MYAGVSSVLLLAGAIVAQSSPAALGSSVRGSAVGDNPPAWAGGEYSARELTFEPNRGQTAPEVRYLSRGKGYTLLLKSDGAVMVLDREQGVGPGREVAAQSNVPASESPTLRRSLSTFHLRLVGASPMPETHEFDMKLGKVSYIIGKDSREWLTNIPTFAKVRFGNVYEGVDLYYYGSDGALEYDFVVSPHANPGTIRLALEGAEAVEMNADGNVAVLLSGGLLTMRQPRVYQEDAERRVMIPSRYRLASTELEHVLAFEIGDYDSSRPLVIDPVLVYSTYLGGSAQDAAADVAVDVLGNAYVVGQTPSTDFPTVSAIQGSFGGVTDAFVTKFDPTGAPIFSTYLGGVGQDVGQSVAVDGNGNAYVTGTTASPDFPVVSPLQPALAGLRDAFVAKVDATGTALVYSTFLGGGNVDVANDIAVDATDAAYITGTTDSLDFPLQGPLQGTLNGVRDAFVTKVDPTGAALAYSTFFGGSGADDGFGIAVDTSGSVVLSGRTNSLDLPTLNAIQPIPGGAIDTFLTRLNSAGSALVYSTYLGGAGDDRGSGVVLDLAGNAVVTGLTDSPNFPTAGALQATLAGPFDAFVAKVNGSGSTLLYSTYFGGSGFDGPTSKGIAIDERGNVYLTGSTDSADLPTLNAVQATLSGASDAYLVKLSASGLGLYYSTYLGGSDADVGGGVAVHPCTGSAYVAGFTQSTDFPTVSPFQGVLAGLTDAFVTLLEFPPAEQIQALRNQVAALATAGVLNAGQANALDGRLQQALAALTGGDTATAISRLQTFVNQVTAFVNGNILTGAQGQILIDGANEVIAVLNC